jgi:hypothetical protein
MSNVPGVVGTGLRYHQAEAQHVDIILRFFSILRFPHLAIAAFKQAY